MFESLRTLSNLKWGKPGIKSIDNPVFNNVNELYLQYELYLKGQKPFFKIELNDVELLSFKSILKLRLMLVCEFGEQASLKPVIETLNYLIVEKFELEISSSISYEQKTKSLIKLGYHINDLIDFRNKEIQEFEQNAGTSSKYLDPLVPTNPTKRCLTFVIDQYSNLNRHLFYQNKNKQFIDKLHWTLFTTNFETFKNEVIDAANQVTKSENCNYNQARVDFFYLVMIEIQDFIHIHNVSHIPYFSSGYFAYNWRVVSPNPDLLTTTKCDSYTDWIHKQLQNALELNGGEKIRTKNKDSRTLSLLFESLKYYQTSNPVCLLGDEKDIKLFLYWTFEMEPEDSKKLYNSTLPAGHSFLPVESTLHWREDFEGKNLYPLLHYWCIKIFEGTHDYNAKILSQNLNIDYNIESIKKSFSGNVPSQRLAEIKAQDFLSFMQMMEKKYS